MSAIPTGSQTGWEFSFNVRNNYAYDRGLYFFDNLLFDMEVNLILITSFWFFRIAISNLWIN
ncbi:hypothetical protein HYN51_13025 [Limnobaculum parvum]|uniref:Uncharacterized protein n=1 Tax=Limnobaculum parvum TaxID=2172103 RepID=A0A2Y9U113_9GAMM|nr:hypothetical protein HYN51_13025 [Limnobaculum parvum]